MNRLRLIERMNEIAKHVSINDHVLAVLALGSIGVEQERLDDYSDLDFFIVTEDDIKQQMIDDLSWLNQSYPVAFSFKNTKDGYKFFFEDGIYGEFAIFGRSEIPHVVQNQARLVYQKEGYEEPTLLIAKSLPKQDNSKAIDEIHEAITNLYVGVMRALRGERLSAQRFIEHYAVDHILKAYLLHHPIQEKWIDPFNLERRIESHDPYLKPWLISMIQGYSVLGSSAESILSFAENLQPLDSWIVCHLRQSINQLKTIEKNNKKVNT